jgi:hypothetical protein
VDSKPPSTTTPIISPTPAHNITKNIVILNIVLNCHQHLVGRLLFILFTSMWAQVGRRSELCREIKNIDL